MLLPGRVGPGTPTATMSRHLLGLIRALNRPHACDACAEWSISVEAALISDCRVSPGRTACEPNRSSPSIPASPQRTSTSRCCTPPRPYASESCRSGTRREVPHRQQPLPLVADALKAAGHDAVQVLGESRMPLRSRVGPQAEVTLPYEAVTPHEQVSGVTVRCAK